MNFDEGSFRDPAGRIFYKSNKIFRLINDSGKNRIKFVFDNKIIEKSIEKGYLIKCSLLNSNEIKDYELDPNSTIIEHEKIPYISYPYEWGFNQLKAAALHHLDFHLFLLNHGATLIDANAYNIQFIGSKPIFIDVLSIKKYEEGEYWLGHKQFCENFLNPLLLTSKKGVAFNNWFKGNLEGIPTQDLNNLLNFFDKISFNIFLHVYLLNRLDKKYKPQDKKVDLNLKKKFPKKNFLSMLNQLKNFISSLNPKRITTVWENYSLSNTYKATEENIKTEIVKKFILKNKFSIMADLGCNDGFYSKIATDNGAKYVVGFDYDANSIDMAFKKNDKEQLIFLPLIFDATNPSSNLGWNEKERKSFNKRAEFDGVLALAFEHHLTIAKNIPMEEAINWIISLAPQGLIEFVPKSDPTIQKMMKFKGDIFPDYNEENFKNCISKIAKIVSIKPITESGRKIYEYKV